MKLSPYVKEQLREHGVPIIAVTKTTKAFENRVAKEYKEDVKHFEKWGEYPSWHDILKTISRNEDDKDVEDAIADLIAGIMLCEAVNKGTVKKPTELSVAMRRAAKKRKEQKQLEKDIADGKIKTYTLVHDVDGHKCCWGGKK